MLETVSTKHRDRYALWGIVLGAALVRLAYAMMPRVVRWDEAGHLLVARNLITGHGYSELAGTLDVHLPPLLPLLSAGLLQLGFGPEWATATIHIVTGALLCLPIYGLGRAMYGRRVGFIAAILVAVYPALAAWPFLWGTMTESPFLLCTFSGIWAIWQALHTGRPAWYAAVGLGFGLSYLTRPEGLTYFAVLGLFMVLWHLAHRIFWPSSRETGLSKKNPVSGTHWRAAAGNENAAGAGLQPCPPGSVTDSKEGGSVADRPQPGIRYFPHSLYILRTAARWRGAIIAKLALAVAVCLLVMSPYVIYLHNATGHWILSGKVGLILDISPAYLAHDQAAHDLAVSRLDSSGQEIMWFSSDRFEKSLTQYVLADPAQFFYQVRQNMAETWRALFHQDLFSPWAVGLIVLGMFAQPWTRRRWWCEGLLWASLLPLASFWAFFVIDRFLVGAVPIGLLWAAVGLDHLVKWTTGSLRTLRPALSQQTVRLAGLLPLAATLAFSLWAVPGPLSEGMARMPWSHKAAALWLAAETPPDSVIMTRHTEVGLYANRPSIASPNATWAQLLAYGRARKARYLVVDDWEVTSLRPQLAALLDPPHAPPEVEYVNAFADGHKTLIYRFKDP